MINKLTTFLTLSLLTNTLVYSQPSPPPNIPNTQPIFRAYAGYPPCYRQPVLTILDQNHMIAFIEGRNNSYCSGTDDGNNSSIRLRTTQDGGLTWSSEIELYHGHPDYLSAVYDSKIQRTHLFILNSPNLWTYSDDMGQSWSKLVPPTINIPSGISATPGVAHGIQLQGDLCSEPTCNGKVGRLLVAWVCHGKGMSEYKLRKTVKAMRNGYTDIVCPGCYSCLAYSDDHGTTWTIDATGISNQDGTREASIVQLQSAGYNTKEAVIYATERNMGNNTGHRLHAISLDGGNSFSLFGADIGIPDSKVTNWTGIVAGATRFDGPSGSPNRIIISTPSDPTQRANMTLYTSLDETITWSNGKLYTIGPAGYSDIGFINSTHGAILFENGADEFAQQVSFGYFTSENV